LNAFYYPWNNVPPGQSAGSRQLDGGTVEWQSDSTAGTFYDYSHIKLLAVDIYSAHVITHEYGHNVMHNVYGSSPGTYFPTTDCTSPHYIEYAGGTNCGCTDGWADFWSAAVRNGPVGKFRWHEPCTRG